MQAELQLDFGDCNSDSLTHTLKHRTPCARLLVYKMSCEEAGIHIIWIGGWCMILDALPTARVWTSVGPMSFMVGLGASLSSEGIHSACLSVCILNALSRQFVKLTVKPMALAAGMS